MPAEDAGEREVSMGQDGAFTFKGGESIYVPATVLATISGANSTSACKEKSHGVSQSNAHSASPGSCEDCTNSYARNLQESYTSSRAIGLATANDEGGCWAHPC